MSVAPYSASISALKSALVVPCHPLRLRHHAHCQNALSSLPVHPLQPYSWTTLRSLRSFALTTPQPLHQDQVSDVEDFEEKARPPIESSFHFVAAEGEIRSLPSPELEVKELEELPEQWRRSKIAWLCKELPSYKHSTFVRILNAQRNWITQEDATYVAVHCMRIRENEASFRVYKWMSQQHWFQFNFALATKLADYLGKDRKYAKCREIFDAIINQGRVPSESTFHILTVAYLSAPVEGCLDEACSIYNKMIQLGGYRPRLSLHNSLFRALLTQPGGRAKHYLNQAEFIFHNLVTSDLEVHQDIYAGLIWLHSYQDVIDKERIASLREEMRNAGFKENTDVLISVMRACSKEGDVEETEKAWLKLLESDCNIPPKAFVYRMDLYARIGETMKSLDIFKGMKKQDMPVSSAAYLKIIEVMSKAGESEIAETIFDEYIETGMKHLMPAYMDLMTMYFNLGMHDKLEVAFSQCLARCSPNRSIYNIYLESLVRIGCIAKAEEIFNEVHSNGMIGSSARSCNAILEGYLSSGDFVKAEKIYDMMRQKKYEIKPQSLEKLQDVLRLKRKIVSRKIIMKLTEEQREILVGLLLGGLRIELDKERRNHAVSFEFDENSNVHSFLKVHIHERFYEWLTSSSRLADDNNEIPNLFSSIAHSYFSFFADQFWLQGRPMIPKLIHRWFSGRVLAYWYMYGGLRTSSGDILLKLKGVSREDLERIIKALQTRSLGCRIKRKGRVFWIGFRGTNADTFWKLTEPYILESAKSFLAPDESLSVSANTREEA
ncbi:pentatricopeptide repeat-containing protein OTP51, chloroplastic [Canna indica]|uniref:Protein ORGANELLE TRANSCRIPT PROCESSING 51 n=1 Tax=Canna indica TaxID=4628 RepID=A0AAQ3KJ00_9LILI|nr:pentatricopeptide repeat-containing protein OTP51, chloroplastic [Canna indica]